MKIWYMLGVLYLLFCVWLLFADTLERVSPDASLAINRALPSVRIPENRASVDQWFNAMKPYCNAVEVESWLQRYPPPQGVNGVAYSAACYALAGKIDIAREKIDSLHFTERSRAAGIVFNVGHPVADMGDDKSAGPIMALVVEYQPDNYMALYHAGASEYILGQNDLAVKHLTRFLELYQTNDYYRTKGLEILAVLQQ